MAHYKVNVTRISYCTKTIEVEAPNKNEAGDLAIEKAANIEFNETSADYEIDSIWCDYPEQPKKK